MKLRHYGVILLPSCFLAGLSPTEGVAQSTTEAAGSVLTARLESEAESFMADYAEDLRRGDRQALGRRSGAARSRRAAATGFRG